MALEVWLSHAPSSWCSHSGQLCSSRQQHTRCARCGLRGTSLLHSKQQAGSRVLLAQLMTGLGGGMGGQPSLVVTGCIIALIQVRGQQAMFAACALRAKPRKCPLHRL